MTGMMFKTSSFSETLPFIIFSLFSTAYFAITKEKPSNFSNCHVAAHVGAVGNTQKTVCLNLGHTRFTLLGHRQERDAGWGGEWGGHKAYTQSI